MSTKTDKWLDEHKQDLVEQLRAVVRIPSLEGPAIEAAPGKPSPGPGMPPTPPTPPSPFGVEVRKCEDYVIKIATQMGLDAKDHDGFYATVDAGVEEGKKKEVLGIVAHLDVVPEGTGWEYPAYSSDIVGDKIYGRGTVDDKGPAIASLFALKSVVDSGYKFKRQVRLLYGLNEETGMRGILKYIENNEPFDIGFTPDGTYPVCNSEFNCIHAKFKKEYDSAITFRSGEAANIVPALAKASLNGKEFETTGIQTHGSTPWEGENAAQKMIKLLAAEELAGEDKKVIEVLNKYLGEGYWGKEFSIDFEDQTGKQTLNLGIVKWDEKGFEIVLDLRCPTANDVDKIKNNLTNAFKECGAELVDWNFSAGYFLSEDSEIVKTLMNVYQNRTNDKASKPFSMGGGTYARKLPNCVSFGPEGWLDVCSCHIPNEFILKSTLLENAKMIADAIIALACEE